MYGIVCMYTFRLKASHHNSSSRSQDTTYSQLEPIIYPWITMQTGSVHGNLDLACKLLVNFILGTQGVELNLKSKDTSSTTVYCVLRYTSEIPPTLYCVYCTLKKPTYLNQVLYSVQYTLYYKTGSKRVIFSFYLIINEF